MLKASSNKKLQNLSKSKSLDTPSSVSRDPFIVEALVTSVHAPWHLWTTHDGSQLPTGYLGKKLPFLALYYKPLECQLSATYRAILKIDVLTDPGPVTLCTQVPRMPQIMEPAPQNLSMVTEASLIPDSFLAYLSCKRAWPQLSLVPCQMRQWQKETPLSQTIWLPVEPLGIN